MSKNTGKTGGGRGTNGHSVKGVASSRRPGTGGRGKLRARAAAKSGGLMVEPGVQTAKGALQAGGNQFVGNSVVRSSLTADELGRLRDQDFDATVAAIGRDNWVGITGGRVDWVSASGAADVTAGDIRSVMLPVTRGYAVEVLLAGNDTFTVRRTVAGKTVGEATNIYAENLGDVVYDASCYRNVPFGEHESELHGETAEDWAPNLRELKPGEDLDEVIHPECAHGGEDAVVVGIEGSWSDNCERCGRSASAQMIGTVKLEAAVSDGGDEAF